MGSPTTVTISSVCCLVTGGLGCVQNLPITGISHYIEMAIATTLLKSLYTEQCESTGGAILVLSFCDGKWIYVLGMHRIFGLRIFLNASRTVMTFLKWEEIFPVITVNIRAMPVFVLKCNFVIGLQRMPIYLSIVFSELEPDR